MELIGDADYRPGEYAVYGGHTYRTGGGKSILPRITLLRTSPQDPEPEGLAAYPGEPYRAYFVHPTQLEAWYRTSSHFTWKGGGFDTVGITDGKVTGRYQGSNRPFPALDELQRMDTYVYLGQFPVSEVVDLVEDRVDLLAAWRAEHPEAG